MKTTKKILTVLASAALLFGLGAASAMAGPHPANDGSMTRAMSSATRMSGQQQVTRTMTQAAHTYRAEIRTQAGSAGAATAAHADALHNQTRSMNKTASQVKTQHRTAN